MKNINSVQDEHFLLGHSQFIHFYLKLHPVQNLSWIFQYGLCFPYWVYKFLLILTPWKFSVVFLKVLISKFNSIILLSCYIYYYLYNTKTYIICIFIVERILKILSSTYFSIYIDTHTYINIYIIYLCIIYIIYHYYIRYHI